MAGEHRELFLQLEDAKKLWRYAQSAVSKHHALDDALNKAKARSKSWERKAKAGIERITCAKKERDEAKEKAKHSQLASVTVGDAKVRAEDNLVRVKDSLVIAKEAKRNAEVEVARLEVERTSLMLEIGATKDEVSSLHS